MHQIYFKLELMLKGRDSKKVANNTYVERLSETMIGLRLHSTYVVKATLDWVELDSGGWHTMTTADRMRLAGVNVYGDGRRGWLVYRHKAESSLCRSVDWDNGHPYWDGMRLDAMGNRPLPRDKQPNWPIDPDPIVTVSGWSGMTRQESRRARRRQYDALRSGDMETVLNIRDQLAGRVATLAPERIEEAPLGTTVVYSMSHEMIRQCPHLILMPEHYRVDGHCRCDDPSHKEMIEWGYNWNGKEWN